MPAAGFRLGHRYDESCFVATRTPDFAFVPLTTATKHSVCHLRRKLLIRKLKTSIQNRLPLEDQLVREELPRRGG